MDDAQSVRSVIPRWEPHEAHKFTKPYSRRSSKPEWLEEPQQERFNKPIKRPRAKRGKERKGRS